MKPLFYYDIEVVGAIVLPVLTKIVVMLHSMQLRHPSQFALSFPRLRKGDDRHTGNVLRVFSEAASYVQFSAHSLQNKIELEGFIKCGQVTEVPKHFDGVWMEYRRIRVPNKKSRLHEARSKKLEFVETLPYFHITSKSNGQGFSIHIDAIPSARSFECKPDSYGLSVVSRPFALPSF